jgi:membrane-associated phospholipid phosphatase
MATGNHFWLDVLAGVLLATAALAIVYRTATKRVIAKLL